jgi:hypothetical protein
MRTAWDRRADRQGSTVRGRQDRGQAQRDGAAKDVLSTLDGVADEEITIKLTRDQAFMLSDWLYRMMGTPAFDNLVNEERAVWSPLYTIAGTLNKSFVEIFMPDYGDRLLNARERLLDSLGDIGRPPSVQ